MDGVAALVAAELARRGVPVRPDPDGDLIVRHAGMELSVSLDNLRRTVARDADLARIAAFVDAILAVAPDLGDWEAERAAVYLALERADAGAGDWLRKPIADRVDAVAVHYDPARNGVAWVGHGMLARWGVTEAAFRAQAAANLAAALAAATLDRYDVDGAVLASLTTALPFKTALLLAPNLKDVLAPALGWPLLAVLPDRDFLYLWDAGRDDMVGRVGGVVVGEYAAAPYPLSTEVFRISDDGVVSIGAFPVP